MGNICHPRGWGWVAKIRLSAWVPCFRLIAPRFPLSVLWPGSKATCSETVVSSTTGPMLPRGQQEGFPENFSSCTSRHHRLLPFPRIVCAQPSEPGGSIASFEGRFFRSQQQQRWMSPFRVCGSSALWLLGALDVRAALTFVCVASLGTGSA